MYILFIFLSVIVLVLLLILVFIPKNTFVSTELKNNAGSFLKSLNKPIIEKSEISHFMDTNKCTLEQCLLALSYASAMFATHVIVSEFHVGAVVRGSSGRVYCGGNTEFFGVSLSTCIHGEQSSVHNAFINGEKAITHLAVNAPPCGYCRQFLNELSNADKLIVLIENQDKPYQIIQGSLQTTFLPYNFGPKDLGIKAGMLDSKPFTITPNPDITDDFSKKVISLMSNSYAPYSMMPSAVGITFIDGSESFGVYLENAAYDPSLHPLVAALNYAVINGRDLKNIQNVVLVEASIQNKNQKNVSARPISEGIISGLNKEYGIEVGFKYIPISLSRS